MPAKELYQLLLFDEAHPEGSVSVILETLEEANERGKRMREAEGKRGVNLVVIVLALREQSANVPESLIGRPFHVAEHESTLS